MGTSLTTSQFKYLNGQFLINSISNTNSTYYLFVGDYTTHSNADLQPINDNVYDLNISVYDNMIFGKRITSNDVIPLVKNIPWETGTVYAAYDDADASLPNEEFFTITLEGSYYHFWKCLDNNHGIASTIAPLIADISGANTHLYQTTDGYRWKYMTTVSDATALKFKTVDYFPIIANTTVESSATPGAIDVIKVESQGRKYNNYIDGSFTASDIRVNGDTLLYNISNSSVITTNSYYNDCIFYITSGVATGEYATIIDYHSNNIGSIVTLDAGFVTDPQPGDLYQIRPKVKISSTDNQQTINCVARALVNAQNSNSIHRIEVLERGENYRNATATVLVNDIVGVSNLAIIRPIMPPMGGHGADCFTEFYSNAISTCVTLSNTENGMIPATNQYQQYGILKDPLFANVVLNCSGSVTAFLPGETIYKIKPMRVQANVTVDSANTHITVNPLTIVNDIIVCDLGTETKTIGNNTISPADGLFLNQFTANDKIFITSSDGTMSQIGTVNAVSNNNSLQLTANSLFSCTDCWVYVPNIQTSATLTVLINDTAIAVNGAMGVFQTGDLVVGESSGNVALVASTARNLITKNFDTFIQTYKYSVLIDSNGTDDLGFQQDEEVLCTATGARGYIHSFSGAGTITMLVNKFSEGTFIVGNQIVGQNSDAIGTILNSHEPELEYQTGDILYLENIAPVTRQSNQNETLNIIFNF